MIEAKGLTRYYGEVMAIENVSFNVEKGEIVAFLGPNGAGKTTTMRILTCFLPPSRGTAKVAGYDILENPLKVRESVGYLPEDVPLYPDMTVRSYLDYMAKLRGMPRRRREGRVKEVMERCGISDVADELIGTLSRGYRQRVGLAQALLHDPKVLILDEPTMGLDPRQTAEVRRLIKSMAGEYTIMISTHILPEAQQVCERVIIINDGRIVATDSAENLTARLARSRRVYVEVRGPSEEVMKALRSIDGVVDVVQESSPKGGKARYRVEMRLDADVRDKVAHEIVRRGWGLYELRPEVMSLEEIFLRLTTTEGA